MTEIVTRETVAATAPPVNSYNRCLLSLAQGMWTCGRTEGAGSVVVVTGSVQGE